MAQIKIFAWRAMWRLLGSTLVFLAAPQPPLVLGAEELGFRTLEEKAIPAWRQMEQTLSGVNVRMSTSDVTNAVDPEERRPAEIRQTVLKVAGSRALLESRYPTHSLVWAHNDAYSFRLGGQGNAPQKWTVSYAGPMGVQDNHNVQENVRYDYSMHFVRSPWQVSVTPLTYLVESPYFKLLSLKKSVAGATATVVMEFSFTPPENAGRRAERELTPLDTPMRGGTITFAPELNWAITEYDIVSRGGGRNRRKITYDGMVDGMPRLRRVVDRIGDRTIRCEVSEWTRRNIPNDEFTLAAYGLPEFVHGGNSFFSRSTMLIAGMATLSIVLAAALNFTSKKLRDTPS